MRVGEMSPNQPGKTFSLTASIVLLQTFLKLLLQYPQNKISISQSPWVFCYPSNADLIAESKLIL